MSRSPIWLSPFAGCRMGNLSVRSAVRSSGKMVDGEWLMVKGMKT